MNRRQRRYLRALALAFDLAPESSYEDYRLEMIFGIACRRLKADKDEFLRHARDRYRVTDRREASRVAS